VKESYGRYDRTIEGNKETTKDRWIKVREKRWMGAKQISWTSIKC
jgi:hypothetical protein